MTLVRWVITGNDPDSGRRQGLFQAIAELDDRGSLSAEERRRYLDAYDWFRRKLRKPTSLARSTKPHAKAVAISWFQDAAVHHIKRMRVLAEILESHGVEVIMLKTERPGYVVYEDAWQITAEPFNDTGA